jgi:hypothetical protein
MPAVAFAALEWRPTRMPGSNADVALALLPRAPDDAFRAFVRFPAGWARPEAGYYAVAEEVLILEGDIRLGDVIWRAGGYLWIPANRVRSDFRSGLGCLAFAWFASAPRWTPGAPARPAPGGDRTFPHWRDAPTRERDGEATGHELYTGPEHHTWVLERRHTAQLALPEMHCETLGLRDRAWCLDETPELQGGGPADTVLARAWRRRR